MNCLIRICCVALLIATSSMALAAAPEGVYGWWKGIIEEPMEGKPPARYVAIMTALGPKGTIDYRDLGCGGDLVLEKQEGNVSLYRVHITYGRNKCIDQGLVRVAPIDIDSLQWSWSGSGVSASANLFGPFDLLRAAFDKDFHKLKGASIAPDILARIMLYEQENVANFKTN